MVNAADVSTHVLEIAAELVESGMWVTPDLVISVLLDRYSTHDFASLQVGPPAEVAPLLLLMEVHSKICTYLDSFMAAETVLDGTGVSTGILCLSDCQRGIEYMLHSFAVPTLQSPQNVRLPLSSIGNAAAGTLSGAGEGAHGTGTVTGTGTGVVAAAAATDSNEIDIDEAAEAEAEAEAEARDGSNTEGGGTQSHKKQRLGELPATATPRGLRDYGFGPLAKHPRVMHLFGDLSYHLTPPARSGDDPAGKGVSGDAMLGGGSSFMAKSQVLSLLLRFQNSGGGSGSRVRVSPDGKFSAPAFASFVQDECGVSLPSAGVRLVASVDGMVALGRDCAVMLRHVQMTYYSELQALQHTHAQLMMRSMMCQTESSVAVGCSDNDATAAAEVHIPVPVHVLAPAPAAPVQVPVLSMPSQSSSSWFFHSCIQEIGSSVYSPSFAKAAAAVDRVLSRSVRNANRSGLINTQGKEEGQEKEAAGVDSTQLLTEYLMLHVGSSKYRRGKLTYKKAEDSEDSSSTAPALAPAKVSAKRPVSGIEASASAPPRLRASELEGRDVHVFTGDAAATMATAAGTRDIDVIPTSALRDLCVSAPWRAANSYNNYSSGSNTANSAVTIKDVGRWGEALVYQYLLVQYPAATVTWVNKDEESMACYDLKIEQPFQGSTGKHIITTFVEVKASRFDNLKTFDISVNEWEFACGTPKIHYDIYRVFNAGDPMRVRVQVIRNLHESVKNRSSRLCLAV